MNDKIYNAFNEIKADDQLKENTAIFLQNKINKKKTFKIQKAIAVLACVAFILFTSAFSYNLYFTVSAIVDIDVNPSIELSINRFDRVVGTYAYNNDGERILNNAKIKNKSYKDAIGILITDMTQMGYLENTELFTASLQTDDNKKENTLLAILKDLINLELETQNIAVEQDIFEIDAEIKSCSHEENITPAKYLAVLELQAVDPNANFDNCRNNSVGEIKQQTRNHNHGKNDNNDNIEHNTTNNQQHHGKSKSNDDNTTNNQQYHGKSENNDNANNSNNKHGNTSNSNRKKHSQK